MKQRTAGENLLALLANIVLASILLLSIFVINSFTVHRIGDDFMKQLGISKTAADEKITNSILGGYLDAYGLKNARNIVMGDRSQVAKDLLVYTRNHVNSEAFKKEYAALKEANKPQKATVKTPEELKSETIDAIKKMITTSENGLKTANSTMKPIYEKMLADGKKQLAEAQSPNYSQFKMYEKNYPMMVQNLEEGHAAMMKEWEATYPADQKQFVKRRLQEFLNITEGIDFNAALVIKNGKKYFAKAEYENKDNRWKMAFRAGKDVVEPARAFAQQWIDEIK